MVDNLALPAQLLMAEGYALKFQQHLTTPTKGRRSKSSEKETERKEGTSEAIL